MIPVAAVTKTTMIPFVLKWNVIPIDRMNESDPINFNYDACANIALVRASPELIGLTMRPARDFRLYRYNIRSASSLCQNKNVFSRFILLSGILAFLLFEYVARTEVLIHVGFINVLTLFMADK